tara:strand:- start:407 stop:826 length:420 start_codon:yes stop_codon:yes gene_type:complete
MGRLFLENLDSEKVYCCKKCKSHLVDKDQLISKNFHGKTGRAFLFNKAVNVDLGPPKDKVMMTGLHTVKSVMCKSCRLEIGWTYVFAYEASEKYKEGKFIVERSFIMRDVIPVINSEEDKQLDDEDGGPTANNRIAWVS